MGMIRVENDPYEALNLPHTACHEDIKRSYRQLAKKYHPDTWSAPCFSESERHNATTIFQRVSSAYELLLDKDRKAEYDRDYRLGVYQNNNNNNNNNRGESSSSQPSPQTKRTSSTPTPPPPSVGGPPPLPKGWTTARDPRTGSLYYWHVATGTSSWTHPSFARRNHNDTKQNHTTRSDLPKRTKPRQRYDINDDAYYNEMMDRTVRTSTEADNHRCGAVLALGLCPPLGILACYHSIMVDRCQEKFEEMTITHKNPPRNNAAEYVDSPERQLDLAHGHSSRAGGCVCLGIVTGVAIWTYALYNGDFEWPREWNLDEWMPEEWGK